jgi:hypothetical protein
MGADGEPGDGAIGTRDRNTAESGTGTFIPPFTRTRIAYSEIPTNEQAVTTAGLWHRACQSSGTVVKKTRPRRPQTNGKVERFPPHPP